MLFMQDSCLSKNLATLALLSLGLWLGVGTLEARAEKADRSQPMSIEADALRHNESTQVSVFTGKVIVTKGTIQIRGARLEVRQDKDGNQFGVVTAEPGKLAFFRQKREGLDEYIEGQGQTIDYDGRADTVKFVGQAQLRRYQGAKLSDEFNAGVIVYNNITDVFTLDGQPGAGSVGSLGQPGAPSGRVRAMLGPKTDGGQISGPADNSLRISPALKDPKKP